ncbi:MAG: hypothetical protein KDC92_16465 [Bacteroidetes bacterium]|nr:hypothetical protein [Bacteroidota bacterium]
MKRWIKSYLPSLLLITIICTAGLVSTSCAPKACPANDRPQFNRKRARYATMNHMKRKGGKGQKHRKTRMRAPEFGFFETKFKRSQFKHQTK